jgi:hypothetical protein
MNFLTIEKFNHHSRTSVFRKVFVVSILLVVPFISVATWVWFGIISENTTRVATDINNQITYAVEEP